jgi:hypothetical protein
MFFSLHIHVERKSLKLPEFLRKGGYHNYLAWKIWHMVCIWKGCLNHTQPVGFTSVWSCLYHCFRSDLVICLGWFHTLASSWSQKPKTIHTGFLDNPPFQSTGNRIVLVGFIFCFHFSMAIVHCPYRRYPLAWDTEQSHRSPDGDCKDQRTIYNSAHFCKVLSPNMQDQLQLFTTRKAYTRIRMWTWTYLLINQIQNCEVM